MKHRNREEWAEVILAISLFLFVGPILLAVLVGVGFGLHELWGFSPVLACLVAPIVVGFLGIMVAAGLAGRELPPMGRRPLGRPPHERRP